MKIYTNLEKIAISESLSLKSFEGEIWKEIIGFWNYEISNYGRVKKLKTKYRKSLIRKQEIHRQGYLRVTMLNDNGNRKTKYVHRLVAKAFIPNPENKPEVNHTKEIKNLNWWDELSWMTQIENNNFGSRKDKVRKSSRNGVLSKPIVQLSLNGEFIREYPSAQEADRMGHTQALVSLCARGGAKTHHGYKWMFKSDYVNNGRGIPEMDLRAV